MSSMRRRESMVDEAGFVPLRWLLETYQGGVEPSHWDYYLDEYTFRFKRRTSHSCGKLFYRPVQ